MEAGELYWGGDPDLRADRERTRALLLEYNKSSPFDPVNRKRILERLFRAESDVFIEAPFYRDYGQYIKLGKKIFMNFNCCILDVNRVTIGDGCLFGPCVHIYAATHPVDGNVRILERESGMPVTIGRNCWFGGGAIVCPGVTVGDNCVISAGSIVTKDIPPNSVVAGNPARILKTVPPLKERPGTEDTNRRIPHRLSQFIDR
jgi:maltose O-acetyltransferase